MIYRRLAEKYSWTPEQVNPLTCYQIRTYLCDENDLCPPVFTSIGDKETGIITASEFKAIHDDERRKEHEKFVDRLIEEAML